MIDNFMHPIHTLDLFELRTFENFQITTKRLDKKGNIKILIFKIKTRFQFVRMMVIYRINLFHGQVIQRKELLKYYHCQNIPI